MWVLYGTVDSTSSAKDRIEHKWQRGWRLGCILKLVKERVALGLYLVDYAFHMPENVIFGGGVLVYVVQIKTSVTKISG